MSQTIITISSLLIYIFVQYYKLISTIPRIINLFLAVNVNDQSIDVWTSIKLLYIYYVSLNVQQIYICRKDLYLNSINFSSNSLIDINFN